MDKLKENFEIEPKDETEVLQSRAFEVKALKVSAIIFACIIILGFTGHLFRHQILYFVGNININQGNYAEAIEIYESLGDFGDSEQQIMKANYLYGCQLLESKKYEQASESFLNAITYEDANEKYIECIYNIGVQQYDAGDYESAFYSFTVAGDFGDSEQYMERISYKLFGNNSDSGSTKAWRRSR